MRRVGTRGYKNKWDHTKIDQSKLWDLTRLVRFYLTRLEIASQRGDYFVADYYNEMFELVEEMYTVLGVQELAQDNTQRYKQHKKKVRKAHGSGS